MIFEPKRYSTDVELYNRLSTIKKQKNLLDKKLKQIEYYAKGLFFPVSLLLPDEKSSDKYYSLRFLATQMVMRFSLYDDEERRFLEDFLYLAMSICYFFENNKDAAVDLNYISLKNLAGVLKLSQSDGFDDFLEYKYLPLDERAVSDESISYSRLHQKATMEDLRWYEYDWTESMYDKPREDTFNDFFNIMYVICSAIQNETLAPDFDEEYPVSNSPRQSGPKAKDILFEEEFYEYDQETDPELFERLKQQAYLKSHSYLIDTFSKYADRFPYEDDPYCRCIFLARYNSFRQSYLKYGYKGYLAKLVSDCLDDFLSLSTDLAFLADTESFEKLYKSLYVCTREIEELFTEKVNDILVNATNSKITDNGEDT